MAPHGRERGGGGRRQATTQRRAGAGAAGGAGGAGNRRQDRKGGGAGGAGNRRVAGTEQKFKKHVGGFKARKFNRRTAAEAKKAQEPWNEIGQDGKTGANNIKVDWKPPKPEGAEGDESVEGVTPKSAPAKPPSPVRRGPAGRGRSTTAPAWMTKEDKPPMLALPAPGDCPGSPSSAGRGRGSVKPAWMSKNASDPPSPSFLQGDTAAASSSDAVPDPLGDAWRERESKDDNEAIMPWKDTSQDKWKPAKGEEEGGWDSSWKQDNGGDGWETRKRGKGGKKGRSRSRRKQHAGKREWRDSGQDEWQGKEWKGHGGDQWHQGGGSTWSGNSWKNDSWQAGKNEQQQQRGWQASWDQPLPLRCRVHGKNRSWDKLVEGPEGWVCREDAPCIIYVGGSHANNCDLRALLDDVKGHCDRPSRRTGGAGKVGRALRVTTQKHSRSSKGCATNERSSRGSFSRGNKHSQWADDRDSGRRHVEPRSGRRRAWVSEKKVGGDRGRDRSRRGAGRKKRDASGSGGKSGQLPPPPPPPALDMPIGHMTPVMMPSYPVMGPCFQQVVPIGQKQQQQPPTGAAASPSLTSNMIDVEDL